MRSTTRRRISSPAPARAAARGQRQMAARPIPWRCVRTNSRLLPRPLPLLLLLLLLLQLCPAPVAGYLQVRPKSVQFSGLVVSPSLGPVFTASMTISYNGMERTTPVAGPAYGVTFVFGQVSTGTLTHPCPCNTGIVKVTAKIDGRQTRTWQIDLATIKSSGVYSGFVGRFVAGSTSQTIFDPPYDDGDAMLFVDIAIPTPAPTSPPTSRPTLAPSRPPTLAPTLRPTLPPTSQPTDQPTTRPTARPTSSPTFRPTGLPTSRPTFPPTPQPTSPPTPQPTSPPTPQPTSPPSPQPTPPPTSSPTVSPTSVPTPAVLAGTDGGGGGNSTIIAIVVPLCVVLLILLLLGALYARRGGRAAIANAGDAATYIQDIPNPLFEKAKSENADAPSATDVRYADVAVLPSLTPNPIYHSAASDGQLVYSVPLSSNPLYQSTDADAPASSDHHLVPNVAYYQSSLPAQPNPDVETMYSIPIVDSHSFNG